MGFFFIDFCFIFVATGVPRLAGCAAKQEIEQLVSAFCVSGIVVYVIVGAVDLFRPLLF